MLVAPLLHGVTLPVLCAVGKAHGIVPSQCNIGNAIHCEQKSAAALPHAETLQVARCTSPLSSNTALLHVADCKEA